MIKKSKRFSQKYLFFAFLILLVAGSFLLFLGVQKNTPGLQAATQKSPTSTPMPTPTPKKDGPFGKYESPKIPKKDVSIIFMVGDSMTEALGPHGGKLNEFINTLYKSTPGHQRIVIDNYAKGSTNILGLQEAMKQKMVVGDAVLDPLLSRSFDLILIESFGYNPLSQLGIEGGLKKQTQTLDQLMWLLTTEHPDSAIVFVATMAPHKATYGLEESPGTTTAERESQAKERMEYIKNHMAYAKSHNIPLIDIYDKTLTPDGDGDLSNVNPDDHIHPSFKGRDFISQEIANYIYDNQTFPR
jgi:lysophospholipase L1-like esterase